MSYTAIPSGLIGPLKAIVTQIWTLAASNFDDHDTRLNTLESVVTSPAGAIIQYGNVTPPSGWLLCDGAEVSQATYASLYLILGTSYNVGGETSGYFRVPNLLGRCPIGQGTGTGLTARTIGTKLGEETHVVSTPEMPTHTHTETNTPHSHATVRKELTAGGASLSHRLNLGAVTTPVRTSNSSTTGITINNTGSSSAHNTIQPFQAMTFIIKT